MLKCPDYSRYVQASEASGFRLQASNFKLLAETAAQRQHISVSGRNPPHFPDTKNILYQHSTYGAAQYHHKRHAMPLRYAQTVTPCGALASFIIVSALVDYRASFDRNSGCLQ